jgi:DNA polymerase-4
MGAQHALGRAPKSAEAVDAILVALVDRVTRRLRAAHRVARTVVVRLRFGDFSRATRSHTLPFATAHTETVLAGARVALRERDPARRAAGLTLIGVAVSGLDDDVPASPCCRSSGGRRRARGARRGARRWPNAITRAVPLPRPGLEMPLPPD